MNEFHEKGKPATDVIDCKKPPGNLVDPLISLKYVSIDCFYTGK